MDPSEQVELSIVVPVRNGLPAIHRQLDALLQQEWDGCWELIVAENGSTDGTADAVADRARRDGRVHVTPVADCTGAAAVRNAGARSARGRGLAFCDADDLVGPRWLATIGNALRAHPVVTGPLIVDTLNPAWLVSTRGKPSLTEPMTFHGLFPIVPAGNFGIQRALWDRVGGFDEQMIANEDAELSLRLWKVGTPVHFEPDASVEYRYRGEARVLFAQGLRYGSSRALVARIARRAGVEGVPHFAGWRSWMTLLRWLPRLGTREGRASWAWVAGVRLGIAYGDARYRVLYL